MSIKEKLSEVLISLEIDSFITDLIITVLAVLVWLVIGYIFIIIMRKVTNRALKSEKSTPRAKTVTKLLNNIVKYIIWFIVFMVILEELNVDATPFIASAGVVGLAVGFGAQEIVKDFISGFFIIFDGSFDVGDVIEVDKFKGAVKTLGLRTTTIQNWKGEVKIINNGDIRGLVNFSKNKSLAVVSFGVDYDTDLNKLKEIMSVFCDTVLEQYDDIIEKPNYIGVTELADSSINVTLLAQTNTEKHYGVERDLRKDIVELMEKNNIKIPYPHVVVKNA